MRGNCGGSFKKGLPQSLTDEQGVYMDGYRIAPNCGDFYSDLKIRNCPISNMNRLSSIIDNYQKFKKGMISIKDVYKNPTIAIIECFDLLDYNQNEMIIRKNEQMKDM